jgi:hypothetical protein
MFLNDYIIIFFFDCIIIILLMQKRLFFLRRDGWFEVDVTARLLNSSNEELLQWTYAMMDKHGYRNYLITENPGAVVGGRYAGA